MEFKLLKSSDFGFEEKIDINKFSQIIDLCKNEGGRVIIDTNKMEIEIYDDYRE